MLSDRAVKRLAYSLAAVVLMLLGIMNVKVALAPELAPPEKHRAPPPQEVFTPDEKKLFEVTLTGMVERRLDVEDGWKVLSFHSVDGKGLAGFEWKGENSFRCEVVTTDAGWVKSALPAGQLVMVVLDKPGQVFKIRWRDE